MLNQFSKDTACQLSEIGAMSLLIRKNNTRLSSC